MIQDLTPDLAQALGLPRSAGALVARVEEGTPAERAGIRSGDVVIAVNGRPVSSSRDLRNAIGLMRTGTKVELTILRDGKEETVTAVLDESQESPDRVRASRVPAGAELEELRPGMSGYGRVEGVAVRRVAPGSPAARIGLRSGDVILAVNREAVKSVAELQRAIEKAGPVVALRVYRDGAELYLVAR
jgi:S1-C subfamily serine protease